MKFINPVDMI